MPVVLKCVSVKSPIFSVPLGWKTKLQVTLVVGSNLGSCIRYRAKNAVTFFDKLAFAITKMAFSVEVLQFHSNTSERTTFFVQVLRSALRPRTVLTHRRGNERARCPPSAWRSPHLLLPKAHFEQPSAHFFHTSSHYYKQLEKMWRFNTK